MIATMSNLSALVKKLQEHGITLVGPQLAKVTMAINRRWYKISRLVLGE